MADLFSKQSLADADRAFRQGLHQQAVSILSQHSRSVGAHVRLREYFLAERKLDNLSTLLGRNPDPETIAIDRAVGSHLQRDYSQAVEQCCQVLRTNPDNVYAMNHLARALFNTGEKDRAESLLIRGLTLKPDFAEMHNNLGHVKRDKGDLAGAAQCFQRALELMPTFMDALMNMGTTQLALGRPEEALTLFRKVREVEPANFDAQVNIGSSLHMLKRYDEARKAYLSAIEAAPERSLLARRQLGKLLIEAGEIDAAIEVKTELVRLYRKHAELHAELVSALELANRTDDAYEAVSNALALFPGQPILLYEKAKLQRRKGDIDSALKNIRQVAPDELPPHLRPWFYFELGTQLDRAADFSGAYQAFLASNRLASNSMKVRTADFTAFDRSLDAMSNWVSRGAPMPPFESDEDLGEDLCFLLGFPRSGTTLLDVMLDGRPDVICLEEQQTMEHAFHLVDSQYHGFPGGLSMMNKPQRAVARACYRDRLKHFGVASDGPLIVDKMPIRTPYLGFILRLFPRAKVLFSLRHPCDVVLSNFMQNYAPSDITIHFHSIEETARIYSKIVDIWSRTAAILGVDAVHYVKYENLIVKPDVVLRGVCDYLGIPHFDDNFDHRNNLAARGRIRTNSYHQVAEPIYLRAEGRWKNYRPQMNAVIDRLRPAIGYFQYEE